MSRRARIPRALARSWADRIVDALEASGTFTKIVVVGSIRRERDEVGDIEILGEPICDQGDLFSAQPGPSMDAICRALSAFGPIKKAGPRFVQVAVSTEHGPGPYVDLYMCYPPAAWGVLLAIRTGPADLGREAVTRIRERGWRVKDGRLWIPQTTIDRREWTPAPDVELREHGELGTLVPVETSTESDFFYAAGIETVAPDRRDMQAAQLLEDRRRQG